MHQRTGVWIAVLMLLASGAGCEFTWIQTNFVVQQELKANVWTRIFSFTSVTPLEIRKGKYGVSGTLVLTGLNSNPGSFQARIKVLDQAGNTTETLPFKKKVTVANDGNTNGCLKAKKGLEVPAGNQIEVWVKTSRRLKNPGAPFHPLFNPLIWKAGC